MRFSIITKVHMKRILFWFVMSGLPCVITLSILEIALRLADHVISSHTTKTALIPRKYNYVADTSLIYRPGDPFYFWDNKIDPPTANKPANTLRVFALGDSFVKAHKNIGLENSFYRVLERKLKKRSEVQQYQFFHFGVSGYCERQFVELLQRYGTNYNPDIIIVQVYLGNDVAENAGLLKRWFGKDGRRMEKYLEKRPERRSKIKLYPTLTSQSSKSPISHFRFELFSAIRALNQTLYWHSYAVRFIQNRIKALIWKVEGIPLESELEKKIHSTKEKLKSALALVHVSPTILSIMETKSSHRIQKAWEITENLLVQIKEKAKSLEAPLLFVLVPHELQVNEQAWQNALSSFYLQEQAYDRDLPSQKFIDILNGLEINYLDLRDVFKKHIQDSEILYRGHFSKTGHAVVGGEIYNALLEKGFVQ